MLNQPDPSAMRPFTVPILVLVFAILLIGIVFAQSGGSMFLKSSKNELPSPTQVLPGRNEAMSVPETHFVNGHPLQGPYPQGMEVVYFGMGCFWGAERKMWQQDGVFVTAAGYAGGSTPNPTYEEVCSGLTGHAEVVQVVFDPRKVNFADLLKVFWEVHDPTQGMRQGNDIGTQYRSAIYCTTDAQLALAETTRSSFQAALAAKGYGKITTEIAKAGPFYFAEDYHQQYLGKNPDGYCGLRGTGVSCPAGETTL